ncbi:MAG TPA: hypothetical protein VM867_08445 [Xanthobacteraceae bacterium]|nr:hypothetical protein [Xanthobacteraceae bacterium]
MSYICAGKKFASLSEAKVFAELIFKSKGVVAAIEAKGDKAAKKLAAARIQAAVTGFIIPMMSIPKLYKELEAAIAAGKSDDELKAAVAAFYEEA